MEAHFLNELVSGVERESHQPWYNGAGDCIVYQMIDEATVAERVDEVLTVYHSVITGHPIGFQVKGVMALTRKFGWDCILVDCTLDKEELKEISISALLLIAYEGGPKTIGRRKAYAELLDSPFTKSARIQAPDFSEIAGM
jgi:hypothetical protein